MRLVPLLAVAAAVFGCAAPRPALFAVIPDQADGHIGTIVVEADGEKRVIHAPYAAQRVRADGTLAPDQLDARKVKADFGPTLAALPVRPATFTLYFLHDSDELTPESEAQVQAILAELKRRPAPEILVIGHTDTQGGLTHNDELSKARAERMRELLVQHGLPANRIQTAGRGKRELLVHTEDNVDEPRNRRVEISVR
ncbi:MAG TPA: OmpA family protein [Usitatibacter sp.]|nr:OmpA family protein [Usitatibacter sp.]